MIHDESPPKPGALARWRPALAIGAASFAFLGQYLLSNAKPMLNDGLVMYFVGVAAFLPLALIPDGDEATRQRSEVPKGRSLSEAMLGSPARAVSVVLAFGLAYLALKLIQSKSGPASYWDAVVFWMAAIVALTAAFVPRESLRRPQLRSWFERHRPELLALFALTFVAGLLRFVALGTIPDIVVGDEGRIGALGLEAARGQINNPFATVFGHSTLYLLFIGIPEAILGFSPLSMRLTSAMAGTVTIPLVYLLGRRMFGPRVGMVAAALMTFAHIHIHFSRLAVNGGIVDVVFATLALYFLYRAVDESRALFFALTGVTVGLHLYFYQGGRLMALVVPAYLVCLAIVDRRRVVANLHNLAVLLASYVIVGAPMIHWAMTHPQEFMARANQVGIIQNGWLAQESLRTGQSELALLWAQFYKAMLAFIYYPATAFYDSSLPMFDFVTSIPLVLGLAYSLARTLDRRFLLLNVWFFMAVGFGQVAVVLPEIGVYRILVMMPAAALMATVALDRWAKYVTELLTVRRRAASVILGLVVAAVAVVNVNYYFREFAFSGTYGDHATRLASIMGTYLGTLDRDYTAYLFGAPVIIYGVHPSVDFLSGKLPVRNVNEPLKGEPTFVDRNRSAVFLFIPQREQELAIVEQYFPGGTKGELRDIGRNPLRLIVYEVPRGGR